jgi:Flp pilus assembly protein protease CpaA
MLVTKPGFLVLQIIDGEPFKNATAPSVIGLVIGLVLFYLPMMYGISIGAGDLKFSAVIGYCVGYMLYLQAMIIMAVFVLAYLVYLLVTQKGNLKTFTAMGPYLAIGSVLTMLFPYTAFMVG